MMGFDINHVTIEGRIVRDPRALGTAGVAFTVASNGSKKVGDKYEDVATVVDIVQFGKASEFTMEKIAKGTPVVVNGRLGQNTYKDKDGNERTSIQIIADRVVIGQTGQKQEGGDKPSGKKPGNAPAGGTTPVTEEDIPF